MHTVFFHRRNLDPDHGEEFLHMFDVTELLLMAFFLGSFCMELVSREEGVDELPVGTIRYIDSSDLSDLFEEFLRIEELILGSDVVEISILDDFLELRLRFREEDGCHDESFDLLDSLFFMFVRFEPTTSDFCTDEFIFIILFCEPSIMEEASKLEVFKILSVNSLCKREISRTIKDSNCMRGVMVLIVIAFSENIETI